MIASWWRTRRALGATSADLAQRRARLWSALQPALARTPALALCRGRLLEEYPITEPAVLRADYGAWNSLGMSDAQLRLLADASEAGTAQNGLSAGWSTGSGGGARGLFVATPEERAEYLGQSLARLLPARALLRRQRLALHLRAGNALYSDVRRRRFGFAHFPLEASTEATIARLTAFDPTILVAPPHRLLALARAGLKLPSLRHLFYGSEPLGPAEAAYLGEAFGRPPRAIYQATEGFLGAECRKGRLHLNEHTLHVELEPVAGTGGFRPIVTDLCRVSQLIVRVRSDDFVELDPARCPCGFGARVIRPVQGRVADIWQLAARTIAPPQVVEAIEHALEGPWQWQATASRQAVRLTVEPGTPVDAAQKAALALGALSGQQALLSHNLAPWAGPKRRKVVWAHG